MAYDYEKKPGDVFVSYPHYYTKFIDNEKQFKRYLMSYLSTNEPGYIAVGITKDLRLVCKPNPLNSPAIIQARRDERKKNSTKSKTKGRKK